MFLEIKNNTNRGRCLININQITSILERKDGSTLIILVHDSIITSTPYDEIIDTIKKICGL